MSPEELRATLRQQPFEPFRLVMTDGIGYDIRHPDLVLIGQRTAVVGLTANPVQTFYERTVKIACCTSFVWNRSRSRHRQRKTALPSPERASDS